MQNRKEVCAAQETLPEGDRWLLVADLDDTLLGAEEDLAEFLEQVEAAEDLSWAVNSSRPLRSIRAGPAPLAPAFAPDAWIGAMGTELEVDGRPLTDWTGRFSGWDRGPVDRLMAELGFAPHADEFQTPLKASFTVPFGKWEAAKHALREAGIEARVICSGASDFDVLVPGAGKGEATRHLARHLGIAHERLIVAGDSANDLAMFEVSCRGILVGNARSELRLRVRPEHVYDARAPRARGVLEGLRHYGALKEG